MDRTEAVAWVLSICVGVLRKSQAKTLSELVAATVGVTRCTLAGIGRELAAAQDRAAKHAIKRVWRFVVNQRIEPVEVMPLVMTRLWRRKLQWHRRRPDRRPLLVSLDWTKVRRYYVLMAAVVVAGRALPLCWQSYRDKVQGKSQNALEEGMLAHLRAALPPELRLVILADRGCGRAELARTCQTLQLDYLIRIKGDVRVRTARWQGLLQHYPARRGMAQYWPAVEYRADGLVRTNLILRWPKDLPAERDEPWYLITSLGGAGRAAAQRWSDLYALRFDIVKSISRNCSATPRTNTWAGVWPRPGSPARSVWTACCSSWPWPTCCWWPWGCGAASTCPPALGPATTAPRS